MLQNENTVDTRPMPYQYPANKSYTKLRPPLQELKKEELHEELIEFNRYCLFLFKTITELTTETPACEESPIRGLRYHAEYLKKQLNRISPVLERLVQEK